MKILGIDPGLATTGYGIIERVSHHYTIHASGAIRTEGLFSKRLLRIHRELSEIITQNAPQELAIEAVFFGKNRKTAVAVSHARGVILMTCAERGLKTFEYTPLEVKKGITGYGQANKEQIGAMLSRILGLREAPKPDDTADALAIAICHANTHKALQRSHN